MSGYGIKTVSCALRCARCKWYSGYDSTKGGVINIDTRCTVCGARLRHTRTRHDMNWSMKTVAPAYARGSGAHNRSQSVIDVRTCAPRKGKITASNLNIAIMMAIANRDGVNLEDVEGQFFKGGRQPDR